MSFINKMKESITSAIDSNTPMTRPEFVKEVLVIQVELEKYQTLLSNVEMSYGDGQIDKEDYETLKVDHESKITSLKAKIMSWSREYLDLKNGLTLELDTLKNEKSDAEMKLEKIEKHYSLQLITEEEYNDKKNTYISTIKQTTSAIERKQAFYDEIIVISPYIEEN